ncbi:MAG: hypothetical protein LC730_05130, partial [Acidobacteria bacterium]|nr:hypothetical protein [Acidobacteriota bacterium]
MFFRLFFSTVILLTFAPTHFTSEPFYYRLAAEPLIRIGLSTNASSVSITTSDTQLVAHSPDEVGKFLATNRVSVSARSYR